MSVLEGGADDGSIEGRQITFVALPGTAGMEVVDPIEHRRYGLRTPGPVTPRRVATDQFRFPVDAAVSISAGSITLPRVEVTYVRDAEGRMLAEIEHVADETFPPGAYTIEICAPIKIYLRLESGLSVTADMERTRIEFDEETSVAVGARSHHEHPAATVTTTGDPEDVMAAVSSFGSALKTTSPERSFPSLRGHPPRVELGEALSIPDGLEPPSTDVELALPPTYEAIFAGAPLSYFLGAEMVPSQEAELRSTGGLRYALDGPGDIATAVERLLKQTFLLECVVRTEGHYPVDLYERRAVASAIDIDVPGLYGRPLAERLETYLQVPFDAIEEYVPTWWRTAHVTPRAESVELLAHVVNDLAIVRPQEGREIPDSELESTSIDDHVRGDDLLRSTATADSSGVGSYVRLEESDSLEQAWVGDGVPMSASKLLVEAFDHRLERTPTTGNIDISIVCNDPRMEDERESVDDVYGSRDELPFDVTIHQDITTGELREVLSTGTDFLHYIGHIDDEGFECADGKLDVGGLDSVAVDAFLLNACRSYTQGMELVKTGSIGGIVTLSDVINSGAVRVGRAIAQLLNNGFPLHAALEIARDESVIGGLYIVVGDGGLAVTQPDSIPELLEIERSEGWFEMEYRTFPTRRRGMGTMVFPFVETNTDYYIASGSVAKFKLTVEELETYLEVCGNLPVKLDGELTWTDRITFEFD